MSLPTSQPTIVATGLNGLVGSKFRDVYNQTYQFVVLDISDPQTPIDITNYDQVATALSQHRPSAVVHLAAFTDVTKAWEQQGDTTGLAYQVNVIGTQNIVTACEALGIHVIHISTAYVFDGEKDGLYTEEDTPHPIEWYGQTKAEAEAVVLAADCPATILRIDFPFRSDPFPRPDIVRKTLSGMAKGYPLFTDHFFGPTYLDDFARVMDWAIRTKTTGLFNASSGEQWSDYQLGQKLFELGLAPEAPKAGTLQNYLASLQRPYQKNTALDTQKLQAALDFSLTSIADALSQVVL
jgi:dTDP-4-dehydrorhamnose reductase